MPDVRSGTVSARDRTGLHLGSPRVPFYRSLVDRPRRLDHSGRQPRGLCCARVIADVRERGDEAVREYSHLVNLVQHSRLLPGIADRAFIDIDSLLRPVFLARSRLTRFKHGRTP